MINFNSEREKNQNFLIEHLFSNKIFIMNI